MNDDKRIEILFVIVLFYFIAVKSSDELINHGYEINNTRLV